VGGGQRSSQASTRIQAGCEPEKPAFSLAMPISSRRALLAWRVGPNRESAPASRSANAATSTPGVAGTRASVSPAPVAWRGAFPRATSRRASVRSMAFATCGHSETSSANRSIGKRTSSASRSA